MILNKIWLRLVVECIAITAGVWLLGGLVSQVVRVHNSYWADFSLLVFGDVGGVFMILYLVSKDAISITIKKDLQ